MSSCQRSSWRKKETERERGRLTLARQQLERGRDTQELMLHLSDVQLDITIERPSAAVLTWQGDVPGHQLLEHLHQVLEKINVDQMGKSRDAPQRCRQERGRMRILQDAEIQHKKQLQRLGLLDTLHGSESETDGTQTGRAIPRATHIRSAVLLVDLGRGFVHLLRDLLALLEHLLRLLAQVRLVRRLALCAPRRGLSLGHRSRLRLVVRLRLRRADPELRLET